MSAPKHGTPQKTGRETFEQPAREVSPHRNPGWTGPEKAPVQPARHSSPGEHKQPPKGPRND